jgi:D-alanyl-lipoteichoic acid acyltransferase DltB (MBOAT superfamily)
MLFNSINFLFFVPIVLVLLRIAPQSWRKAILLAASYFFYGSWDWRFLGLILFNSSLDYLVASRLHAATDPARRLWLLRVSLGANLGVLAFFKYFNFFIASAADLLDLVGLQASLPTLRVILPVGISFYTFQSMSYVIDVYRRNAVPADDFVSYALFHSYFPQLVAGPISRTNDLLPQLQAPSPVTLGRINAGILLILLGLAKKVLIADMIAPEVDRIFARPEEMSAGLLLRGAYLFAFQIYGDFAGYSDMARGVSEFFGVRLMINFEQPYLSQSITEFWRRWHISLSSWLRDYLYIPLGGNRQGTWMTYRNLMLTMLIGGLWHGASWTFVAWGGWHGVFLAIERALGIGGEAAARRRPLGRRLWATVATFHVAVFGWVFFRAPSFENAFAYFSGIAQLDGLAAVGMLPFVAGAAILAMDIPQDVSGDHTVFLRLPWWLQSPVYVLACLGVLLYGGREIPFIYFQF